MGAHIGGPGGAGLPADASVARIKGPEGTSVTLTVRTPRDSAGKKLGAPRELKLQRKQIEVPITSGHLIKRKGKLNVHRVFAPQGAVIVEGRHALRHRDETGRTFARHGGDKIQD